MKDDFAKKISAAVAQHNRMIAAFEQQGAEAVAAAARAIIRTIKKRHRVYICGNGGSAADAQHIASELVGRFRRQRAALPAAALTTDTSAITSIANDYGYDDIFSRQVEALVRGGDILWAISTSGASANVLAAARLARKKGAYVLAFTGRRRSKLEDLADICFCADSTSTARSQEVHQLAYHIICDLVEESFCKGK